MNSKTKHKLVLLTYAIYVPIYIGLFFVVEKLVPESTDYWVSYMFLDEDVYKRQGDNGIAIAMSLAILDSDEYEHPRLEFIATVDEEVGLLGAASIDVSRLTAKKFINIDSEEEGIFTVSCAGGVTAVSYTHLDVYKEAKI